jgi:crotonobetainyl-CoA:carnitine CoA-transferase CaiB-like acyl-CoA transferase
VLDNFGLAPSLLAEENPGLVVLSMPAFPPRGCWSGRVAYGGGIELAAGLAPLDGRGVPSPAPVPYLDYLSGGYGAAAVLAALIGRDRDGRGATIELPQWAVAATLLEANGNHAVSPPNGTVGELLERREIRTGDLLARDPQTPCAHYWRPPFVLGGVREARERQAPGFGADSRSILERFARLRPEEVTRLIEEGVVVEVPE